MCKKVGQKEASKVLVLKFQVVKARQLVFCFSIR